jgi:hypothetical protein
MATGDIDISVVKNLLTYDPSTGIFRWIRTTANRVAGSVAGTWCERDGVYIRVINRRMPAIHIAYAFIHDRWPTSRLTHINGDKFDNRAENIAEKAAVLTAEEKTRHHLTHKYLTDNITYSQETGLFMWIKRGCGRRIGKSAGCRRPDGYYYVSINTVTYLAHKLAWFYIHGEWPPLDVDHIDGNPSNNRLSNLRLATKKQNMANCKRFSTNKSGYKGVSWKADEAKWQAQIRVDGKTIALGRFVDPKKAHDAYCKAALEHLGEFARVA